MGLKSVHGRGRTWYVPTYQGNDKSESPTKVEIKKQTGGYAREKMVEFEGLGDKGVKDSLDAQTRVLMDMVGEVKNYEDDDGVPITDAAGLIEMGDTELLLEIAGECLVKLGVTSKKKTMEQNSSEPQDSSQVETSP